LKSYAYVFSYFCLVILIFSPGLTQVSNAFSVIVKTVQGDPNSKFIREMYFTGACPPLEGLPRLLFGGLARRNHGGFNRGK